MKMKNKNNKVKKFLIDKVLLILSALLVGLGLLSLLMFFERIHVQDTWKIYILVSVLYITLFIYGTNLKVQLKKIFSDIVSILLLIFFAVFPILIGFMIFYFRILDFPKRPFTYLTILLFIIPASVVLLEQLLEFLYRRKHKPEGSGGHGV